MWMVSIASTMAYPIPPDVVRFSPVRVRGWYSSEPYASRSVFDGMGMGYRVIRAGSVGERTVSVPCVLFIQFVER